MLEFLNKDAVQVLLEWYDEHKRDLPWRHTKDPYRIWLSEIMLQQTRVEAVKPYYARFLKAAPDVATLASMPQDALYKLWEGLGYYSRARNLQKAANTVMSEYGGVFPEDYDKIRKLSGIGDYTAGAIASIAFSAHVPAVDGNVLRVLSRLSASNLDIAKDDTKQQFRKALLPHIPEDAGSFNQALIELGATVCVPNGEPKCHACPLSYLCRANIEGLTDALPIKSAKAARRIELRTVFLITDPKEDKLLLHKRGERGLLAGLYEFPNTEGHLTEEEAKAFAGTHGVICKSIRSLPAAKHIFTHIEWHMKGYEISASLEEVSPELVVAASEELNTVYAIPSAFSAYMPPKDRN